MPERNAVPPKGRNERPGVESERLQAPAPEDRGSNCKLRTNRPLAETPDRRSTITEMPLRQRGLWGEPVWEQAG